MKEKIIPDYLKVVATMFCILFFMLSFFVKTVRVIDEFSILYSFSYSQDITIFEMLNMKDGIGIHPNMMMVLWVLISCVAAISFIWINNKIGYCSCAVSLFIFMLTTLSKNYDLQSDKIWSWKPYEGYYSDGSKYRFMTFGKYYNSYYVLWFISILIILIAILLFVIKQKEIVPENQIEEQLSLDDLIKAKDLLDKGIITEEEFTTIKEKAIKK